MMGPSIWQTSTPSSHAAKMTGPSTWQTSTPSRHAANITPQAQSSDGVSSENPIAIDFSNATPMTSPFEFGKILFA
eukprot:scaffold123890_cov29-Attheya_sp.AAC.1